MEGGRQSGRALTAVRQQRVMSEGGGGSALFSSLSTPFKWAENATKKRLHNRTQKLKAPKRVSQKPPPKTGKVTPFFVVAAVVVVVIVLDVGC